MPIRLETASGLRLYASNISRQLYFISDEDIIFNRAICVEVVFKNNTIAKWHRLNDPLIHKAIRYNNIIRKSIFKIPINVINTPHIIVEKEDLNLLPILLQGVKAKF